jgi:hypothetical protein
MQQELEVNDPRAYEMIEPYVIRGGLYDPREKTYHAGHRKGLIRTSSIVGEQELNLVRRAPYTLSIGKEMTRFEAGEMGKWVADYNAFTHHFKEVLRSIGRLRDLLSAGAPEAPTDLTPVQKRALRPTDDTKASGSKKDRYRQWRAAQDRYAAEHQGKLVGGFVFEVAQTGRDFDFARQAFWQAQGKLARSVAEGKRLKKPQFEDIDVSLADIAGVVSAGSVPGAAIAGLGILVDWALEARKHRKEYDAKMKQLEQMVKNAKGINADDFEAFKGAGEKYWAHYFNHRRSIWERDKARDAARQAAALLGQELAPLSETRGIVLGAIRMPALVSDAWRSLAIIGPNALKKLSSVLAARELIGKAKFHYQKTKPDPYSELSDIIRAYNMARSWRNVLTQEEIDEWKQMNKLWVETFDTFNV